MNTPTHILSGVMLGQVVLAVIEVRSGRPASWRIKAIAATAVFAVASLLHLGLDAIPHWFWVGHVGAPLGVRFEWFFRAAVAGALTLIPIAIYCRRDWFFSLVCGAGGLFPDLEKAAYFMQLWPARLVIFPSHGTYISNHTGGLPFWMLVSMELLLIAVMIGLLRGLWVHRRETSTPS
jgi:hypothetical protein